MKPSAILATLLVPACLYADSPGVARLEIHPAERILYGPANTQQLSAIAHFSDGSKRDVTRLTAFTSSDPEAAGVDSTGRVHFFKTCEVAIQCRYRIATHIRLTYVESKPGFVWPNPPVANSVDHHVFSKLKLLQIPPAELCADHVFVRRAYLDVCGALPTPAEVRRFMNDRHPLKRSRLIDELLDRPAFAEYWARHWINILGINWRLDRQAGATLLRSFKERIQKNTPMDLVVRELIHGKETMTEKGPVSFYTGAQHPPEWADRAGAAFLGVRWQCVQCHFHPRAAWTPEDRQHFIAFFAQITRRVEVAGALRFERFATDNSREWLHAATRQPVPPRFPDGTRLKPKNGQNRQEALAEWLTSPENPYFARAMVNRIWHRLLGKGIADSPETLHEAPRIANDALLDALAKSLVAERFDLKQMVRIIMNSRTYQLCSKTNEHNKEDGKYFSHANPRYMSSELLTDALAQVTEIPAAIEDMPKGTRAIEVLEIDFGPFWFRRPPRIAECEAERGESELASALHMIQNDVIVKLTEHPGNRLGRLLAEKRSDREIMDDLFLAACARPATDAEHASIVKHLRTKERRPGWNDVLWAVVNSREFLLRR